MKMRAEIQTNKKETNTDGKKLKSDKRYSEKPICRDIKKILDAAITNSASIE